MEKIIIKKGDKFLCIKDFVINNTTYYKKGNEYLSERDGCLTNKAGNSKYKWIHSSYFMEYFKPIDVEIKDKSNVFVYYRGDKDRGSEIIEALEKLGGKNKLLIPKCIEGHIYYINSSSIIDHSDANTCKWITSHYTEAFLPKKEEKEDPKFDPFDKVLCRYDKKYKWEACCYYQLVDSEGNLYNKHEQVIPYNEETKHLIYTYIDYKPKNK